MLRKTFVFLILLTTIISILTTIKISIKKNLEIKNNYSLYSLNSKKTNSPDDKIGNLIINKINLNEPLFKITSANNSIEKHVTILKESVFPDQKNSILFLAAHSGTGKIAYFESLKNIDINDEIILTFKEKTYYYQVKNIWQEKKTGYINVNKDKKNQLILTTCSPTKENFQLVINCIEKEK